MAVTLVVTAVDVERDAVADGVGEPQAVTIGPYRHSRRCETNGDDVLVVSGGVGPAAAAAATAYVVAVESVRRIISIGIAGAFQSAHLPAGAVAVADQIVAADLGAMSPERFLDLQAMGLDGAAAVSCDPQMVERARSTLSAAGLTTRVGPVLTLSTMTGTAERAAQLMSEHGAVAEAMEGAGVAHVAALHGLPVLEVRSISNQVGVRDTSQWDILGALETLTVVGRSLLRHGWE